MEEKSTTVDDDIKDFSQTRPAPKFKVNDDVFHGVRDMPAYTTLAFTELAGKLQTGENSQEKSDALASMFTAVLIPSSASVFVERLGSKENPIGLSKAMEIFKWLLEEYGMRPTQPSTDSLTGSSVQESGMKLMEAVQLEASI